MTPLTDQSCRENHHIVSNADLQPTASLAVMQAQVVPSLRNPVSSKTIRMRLAEGLLESRCSLRVLPLTPTHRRLRLEWYHAQRNWTASKWNQVFFSDESRFNMNSDGNRVRVWRPRGKRIKPTFALQRHTTPTADVMRYAYGILQPHVYLLKQRLPGALFHQDYAQPHTARVSQDCVLYVTTLPWPARSPNLSPLEHIWDHLGRRVRHSTSLNELEARLQQIWNVMSQDITQSLYTSMTGRIATCIRARECSTWY
ncbi:transposable element Tcb2 transposase [Trichonephila clavipes]|nr:transposable element Tcb2 transposase [Trichonephila clavipes]